MNLSVSGGLPAEQRGGYFRCILALQASVPMCLEMLLYSRFANGNLLTDSHLLVLGMVVVRRACTSFFVGLVFVKGLIDALSDMCIWPL